MLPFLFFPKRDDVILVVTTVEVDEVVGTNNRADDVGGLWIGGARRNASQGNDAVPSSGLLPNTNNIVSSERTEMADPPPNAPRPRAGLGVTSGNGGRTIPP